MMSNRQLMKRLMARPGRKFSLKDFDPGWTADIKNE